MHITFLLSTLVFAASRAFVAGAVAASTAPAAARSVQKTTVAVIPAQWYAADEESAQRLTEGIRKEFATRGWDLLPEEAVRSAAAAMRLKNGSLYSDATLIRLGRSARADLVVYPRLLALGAPVAASSAKVAGIASAAVVLVRVIDVKGKRALYCNQISHEFKREGAVDVDNFALSASEGQLAATEVLGGFFTSPDGKPEGRHNTHAGPTGNAPAAAAPKPSSDDDATVSQPGGDEHH